MDYDVILDLFAYISFRRHRRTDTVLLISRKTHKIRNTVHIIMILCGLSRFPETTTTHAASFKLFFHYLFARQQNTAAIDENIPEKKKNNLNFNNKNRYYNNIA